MDEMDEMEKISQSIRENKETVVPTENETADDGVETLPVIVLRGKVIFPKTFVNLDVGRDKSVAATDCAKVSGGRVLLVAQKDASEPSPMLNELYTVGTVARISQIVKISGGDTLKINGSGEYRARVLNYEDGAFIKARVVRDDYSHGDALTEEASFREAKDCFVAYANVRKGIGKDVVSTLLGTIDRNLFIDNVLSILDVPIANKQRILETDETAARLDAFSKLLSDERQLSLIQRKIDEEVKKSITENQKEYYLREQLKAIHTELGDDEDLKEKYVSAVKAKNLDKASEEKVLKEIERLDKINPSSPDYSVILNYLDWICDLPFSTSSADNPDLNQAKAVLDGDHFGLEKVKERIVEYLAVLKLTGGERGQILCLVGPPGVGKTSVAKSVARAMNRTFVRMSLGGVKDEAEIRGHRKTYVGAMPGRILYGLKQAGTNNPVFLLDEIDKMSADIHGDPASALLEVLDPEQNATFRDRYVEIPFDLTKVLFITTANDRSAIPAPLLDRMEVIELSGYTEWEKKEIGVKYLVPKSVQAVGLDETKVVFTEEAVAVIAEEYTAEAGVRDLERKILSVARKIATGYALGELSGEQKVDGKRVRELLGKPCRTDGLRLTENAVGVANGLAWTAVGGTTLTIEVGLMEGKGEILLTGKLGDVMKESARAGITYIRANAKAFGIDPERFEKTDIHVHVPEGATPKDGPSAGITMATAIFSAFTKRKVRADVAMTGELTLRGNVLPIGGLKEKALAAARMGITTVVYPKENEKDLDEIPEEIRKKVAFVPVRDMNEVLSLALESER